MCGIFKSMFPCGLIICPQSWSTLLQVMAWCLDSTKPLPESVLTYPWYANEHDSMYFLWKCLWCLSHNIVFIMTVTFPRGLFVNSMAISSLWLSDAIWWHRSWSILVQVMACCLTAPSLYVNQCWKWGLVAFTWRQFCWKCLRYLSLIWVLKLIFKITAASPRGQWV